MALHAADKAEPIDAGSRRELFVDYHFMDRMEKTAFKLYEPPFCHNFSPFLDGWPGVPAAQQFKALAGTVKSGLTLRRRLSFVFPGLPMMLLPVCICRQP